MMSTKRVRSPSPVLSQNIFRSSTIEDQESYFIAAFSPSLSPKELQNLPEFKTATHRVAAWRLRSRQKSLMPKSEVLYDLGHDDDGEKWAGGRLQRILNETNAEGAIVVARWYGGQNIGPVRFTHIEATAKEAILKFKNANVEIERTHAMKKPRVDEDKAKKELEIGRAHV